MRIVLDTNVFISGIFWAGNPGKILDAWARKEVLLVYSKEILEEYIAVGEELSKKYSQIEISSFIELLMFHGELCEPAHLHIPISRDPDDDKFIALAIGGKCSCIVSGDKDLLVIEKWDNVEILKPSEFVKKYLVFA